MKHKSKSLGIAKMPRPIVLVTVMLLLAACGPTVEDAREKGFASVQEMKAMQAKGFASKSEYEASEQKRGGFANIEDYRNAIKVGVATYKEYLRYQINQRMVAGGFESADQLKDAEANGLHSKKDYERFRETINSDWREIYSLKQSFSVKGGVYLENNWFSDNKVYARPSEFGSFSKESYINNTSIKKINEEIWEAAFARAILSEPTRQAQGEGLVITIIQINCASNTIRENGSMRMKIWVSRKVENIDPATGRIIETETPEKREYEVISDKTGSWSNVTSVEEIKFSDVLCRHDYSVATAYKHDAY